MALQRELSWERSLASLDVALEDGDFLRRDLLIFLGRVNLGSFLILNLWSGLLFVEIVVSHELVLIICALQCSLPFAEILGYILQLLKLLQLAVYQIRGD